MIELAKFEEDLAANLEKLQNLLSTNGGWFDSVPIGDVHVVPKRFGTIPQPMGEVRIGVASRSTDKPPLEIQLRLAPSPQFAIVETLYLWKFGPVLDGIVASTSIGNRLDLKDYRLSPTRRWLFQYWPKRYQEFRSLPVSVARRALADNDASVAIVSADLASYYDSVNPSFLLQEKFIGQLLDFSSDHMIEFDVVEYMLATASLIDAYRRYQQSARYRVGGSWITGIPIGALTSPTVANVALASLDRHIMRNPSTISYRRYVDDFVIVSSDPKLKEFTTTEVLKHFIPVEEVIDSRLRIDCNLLNRSGSEFEIQRSKVRVHHLSGLPGIQFLKSVREDFRRLVSERRAFLDPSMILEEVAAHVTRANTIDGSPLRVLRDADRIRLEHFALITNLATLDRISVLVDRDEARRLARGVQLQIGRVLDGEEDWVSNLDLTFRLLRLAIATDDVESLQQFVARMDQSWGSIDSIKVNIQRLVHRGNDVSRTAAWTSLRNYLHERRLESIAAAVRPDQHNLIDSTLSEGLSYRAERLGWRAIIGRAHTLANADLRARDREDDNFPQVHKEPINSAWMLDIFQEDQELLTRLDQIHQFVQRCVELGGGAAWVMPAARLFLSTRPPSYFDIARRWLYRVENGFAESTFDDLLDVVNAVRGTGYTEAVGSVINPETVAIPWEAGLSLPFLDPMRNPRIILGNLVSTEDYWKGAAARLSGVPYGKPILSLKRLRDLAGVVEEAIRAARQLSETGAKTPPALLVLPELALPRRWFRTLSNHLIKNTKLGMVVGLEYLHEPNAPHVINQVFGVFPGPYNSVATWPWTKRLPAREEARLLDTQVPPVSFRPPPQSRRTTTVVKSIYGDISVLICSELVEVQRLADLLRRVEIVLTPSWNTDTHSYDHLIQSAGIQLNAIIAIANNGYYSDCRAWAPRKDRWKRDLCRLINPKQNGIVSVEPPLQDLRKFRQGDLDASERWKPLPPNW